jgi:ribosomal protein S16
MTYVCEGKVYYEIRVSNVHIEKDSMVIEEASVYQLEIDSNDDEWKATYLYPTFKAITLMRWIRQGAKNGNLIQIK